MKIEIRNDSIHVSGYVNAVARDSRLIPDRRGSFLEQVEPGTFRRALESGNAVELRLNHERVLGGTADQSLKLSEDNIGLFAEADITDPEAVEIARRGEFRGWSFGFRNPQDEWEDTSPPRRRLKAFELTEVSLIDRRKIPAYIGTSVEVRDEEDILTEYRCTDEKPEVTGNNPTPFIPDYARKRKILELKRSENA